MNEEFINLYIEILNKKNEEKDKQDSILRTQYEIAIRQVKVLTEENELLKKQLESSLNKTTKSKKEVNTSEF